MLGFPLTLMEGPVLFITFLTGDEVIAKSAYHHFFHARQGIKGTEMLALLVNKVVLTCS